MHMRARNPGDIWSSGIICNDFVHILTLTNLMHMTDHGWQTLPHIDRILYSLLGCRIANHQDAYTLLNTDVCRRETIKVLFPVCPICMSVITITKKKKKREVNSNCYICTQKSHWYGLSACIP